MRAELSQRIPWAPLSLAGEHEVRVRPGNRFRALLWNSPCRHEMKFRAKLSEQLHKRSTPKNVRRYKNRRKFLLPLPQALELALE